MRQSTNQQITRVSLKSLSINNWEKTWVCYWYEPLQSTACVEDGLSCAVLFINRPLLFESCNHTWKGCKIYFPLCQTWWISKFNISLKKYKWSKLMPRNIFNSYRNQRTMKLKRIFRYSKLSVEKKIKTIKIFFLYGINYIQQKRLSAPSQYVWDSSVEF